MQARKIKIMQAGSRGDMAGMCDISGWDTYQVVWNLPSQMSKRLYSTKAIRVTMEGSCLPPGR